MELDKNGADMLVQVRCNICGNAMSCLRGEYHASTGHWRYQCKQGHAWWIGEREILKHAIR